jgi:tRNA-guanine family transglycosylase
MARELLAYRLLSLHNVTFYQGLVAAMRAAIEARRFEAFRARFLDRYGVESGVGADDISADREAQL